MERGWVAVEQVFGSSHTPAAVVDGARRVRWCNRAFSRMLGIAAPSTVETCDQLFRGCRPEGHPVCTPHCDRIGKAAAGGGAEPFLMWCRPRGGKNVLLEGWLLQLPEGFSAKDGEPMCLYLLRVVDPRAEIEKKVEDLWSLHQPQGSDAARIGPQLHAKPHSPLTGREGQILHLLHEGLTTRQMSARLHISETTVRNHIQRIFQKAQAHNRLEAVRNARRNGWL